MVETNQELNKHKLELIVEHKKLYKEWKESKVEVKEVNAMGDLLASYGIEVEFSVDTIFFTDWHTDEVLEAWDF